MVIAVTSANHATPRAAKSVGESIMCFMSDSDADVLIAIPPCKKPVQHYYCLMSRGFLPAGRFVLKYTTETTARADLLDAPSWVGAGMGLGRREI